MRPSRTCVVCGKTKGVTFHVLFVDGKGKSIQAHPKCFARLRQQSPNALAELQDRLNDLFGKGR